MSDAAQTRLTDRLTDLDRPTILVAYAHPDDESFGPSALLAREARRGARLVGVWATRGEHGQPTLDPAPDPAELGRLREIDLREAATTIGFAEVEILGYEDGTVNDVPRDVLAGQILEALRRHHADVLITFGPGGITRHPDHVAVHHAATAAFERARAEGLPVAALYFDAVPPKQAVEMGLTDVPDGNPNVWFDVAETWHVKREALRIHARHVLDAQQFVAILEARDAPPDPWPLYRAFPPLVD